MTSIHVATLSKPNDSSFTDVEIEIQNIEHNLDNGLIIFAIPNKNASDSRTMLIDLARAKEVISVNGILLDENSSSAETKKQNLLKFVRDSSNGKGNMRLVWGDNPSVDKGNRIDGNIVKFSIKELPGRVTDTAATLGSDTRIFSVILQFARGEHKG